MISTAVILAQNNGDSFVIDMSSHNKIVTVTGETFSRFKSVEQIYYNTGFSKDARQFNLLGDEPLEKKRIMKHTLKTVCGFLFRGYTVVWFSLYYAFSVFFSFFRLLPFNNQHSCTHQSPIKKD